MKYNRPEDSQNLFRIVLFSETGGRFVRRNTYHPEGSSPRLLASLRKLVRLGLNQIILEFVMGKDDQVICITSTGAFYWDNIARDSHLDSVLQAKSIQRKRVECAAMSFFDSRQYFSPFGDGKS